MLSEDLKKKLSEEKPKQNQNIGKLIHVLYRYLAARLEDRFANSYSYRITPSHVALLANISAHGGNNKMLANRAIVSKQAMSKLLNETVKEGIIEIEKDKNDNRANNISLTDKGAELILSIWENNHLIVEDIEQRLGKEKAKTLIDLLSELSDSIGYCGESNK